MNLAAAEEYLRQHPDWHGATVDLAVTDIREAIGLTRSLFAQLQALGAYAGDALETGRTRELDEARLVIERTIDRLIEHWTEPLDDEVEDAREQF